MIIGPFYTYRLIHFTSGNALFFVIFVCYYLGRPRVVAATRPCTYLLIYLLNVKK